MKQTFYSLCGFLLLLSCADSKPLTDYSVDITKGTVMKETVLVTGKDNAIDLRLTESFAAIIDYKSDTVLQVYNIHDFSVLQQFGMRGDGIDKGFSNPVFAKSSTSDESVNTLVLVDRQLVKKIQIEANGVGLISPFETTPFPPNWINASNYNLTSRDIMGVPTIHKEHGLFYLYNLEGYYWIPPNASLPQELTVVTNAYLTNLCVNEKANAIVSAFRFINYIQFYDFNTKLRTTVTLGNNYVAPIISPTTKSIDILNTPKCIIDIYGTSNYVYCLYDGSGDYTAKSTILVFSWNGKYIRTFKTDRSINKIAVDRHDKYIIALARNLEEGTDVVKYKLTD